MADEATELKDPLEEKLDILPSNVRMATDVFLEQNEMLLCAALERQNGLDLGHTVTHLTTLYERFIALADLADTQTMHVPTRPLAADEVEALEREREKQWDACLTPEQREQQREMIEHMDREKPALLRDLMGRRLVSEAGASGAGGELAAAAAAPAARPSSAASATAPL
jgi:hypothetical protein